MVIPTGSIFTQDLIKISVSEFSNVKCETSELVHATGYGLYIVTTQWDNIKLIFATARHNHFILQKYH
jgi:hypothetical protein